MNSSNILIVEDDIDQMELLIGFARSEIKKLIESEGISEAQKQEIRSIRIIKVTNINSLQKAVAIHKSVLLAVLDCNIPDTKVSVAHDQLIKSNHVITGQHKPVDIVSKHLPDTPITMISSLNRFQKIVSRYYQRTQNLSVNFISKSDHLMIKRNIGYYLRQHLKAD